MVNYTIYDNKTGEIFRTGCSPEIELQLNNNNESVIEGQADDVCDQVNLETKKVMKDFKTSRQKIQEEEDLKWIEETPVREREKLIIDRMKLNARNKAEQELIDEGIIT